MGQRTAPAPWFTAVYARPAGPRVPGASASPPTSLWDAGITHERCSIRSVCPKLLDSGPTCAVYTVPVELSLRPRVGLYNCSISLSIVHGIRKNTQS